MRPVHLVLGSLGDSCCAGVLDRLTALDAPARIVASPLAPPARFVWSLDGQELTSRLDLDEEPVDVAGVLVRGTPWVDPAGWSPPDHAYVQAEMLAATLAWLTGLPCPVVNRPSAALWYRTRTSLLGWSPLLRRCGLPIPEQLLTNDPAQARAFERRLAADGVAGAVFAPITGESGYLLATEAAWQGLSTLQERVPVRLSEPHGAAQPACLVGTQILWDHDPAPGTRALEPGLRRLAAAAGLEFLEVGVASLRAGPGIVSVDPMPVLEHFTTGAQARILDALTALLVPVDAGRGAVR